MNITSSNTPLVFYNEEAERAQAVQRAREEEIVEENTYGRYGDNPYLSKAKVLNITKSAYDNPDEIRLAREYEEKTRIRRHKTNRSTGNFGLDLLRTLTFSPYEFKTGLGTFSTFFYLGKYKPGQDDPSKMECERLSLQKRDIFWESIASWKFLKGAIVNVIFIVASFFWFKYAIAGLSLKHPTRIIWAIIAFVILWNVSKVFLRSILNVMDATYGTVMKRKEDTDKARKNAEAAEKKAQKEAEDARRAREAEAANNTQSDSETEDTPTTNRFAEFYT